MSVDPRHADMGATADAVPKDLHLMRGSPCKDRGTNMFAGVSAPSTDIDGDPRPLHQGYDIGSDELFPMGTFIMVR